MMRMKIGEDERFLSDTFRKALCFIRQLGERVLRDIRDILLVEMKVPRENSPLNQPAFQFVQILDSPDISWLLEAKIILFGMNGL